MTERYQGGFLIVPCDQWQVGETLAREVAPTFESFRAKYAVDDLDPHENTLTLVVTDNRRQFYRTIHGEGNIRDFMHQQN